MGQEVYDRLIAEVTRALNDRDVDAFLACVHPDADFVPLLAAVEGGSWHGHEGVRRWLDGLFEAWEGYASTFVLLELVSETVAVLRVQVELRGRGSGLQVERTAFQATEVAPDGRAIWWRYFEDPDAARAAAAERAQARS